MNVQHPNSYRTGPDERGHFGIYGGRFVAETLMPLILDLERAYADAKADPKFRSAMDGHLAAEFWIRLGIRVFPLTVEDRRHKRARPQPNAVDPEMAGLARTARRQSA